MVSNKSLEIHLHSEGITKTFNASSPDDVEEFLNSIVELVDRRQIFSVSSIRKPIESSWDVNDD